MATVAQYDNCHSKGLHVHLFNRQEEEFTQLTIRPVQSYTDAEEALDYVQEAGGTAVVAMAADDGTCKIAALWPASEARLAVAKEGDTITDVHEGTHVDMFFDYLTHIGTTAVVRRSTARLVSTGPLQPI